MYTPFWLEMACDAIRLARDGCSVEDYKKFCNLITPEVGKSYYDRIKVAEHLISQGLIQNRDGRFGLVYKTLPDWLRHGLAAGDSASWKLLDEMDPSGKRISKYDSAALQAIGLAGEEFVVDLIKERLDPGLHHLVVHISLSDDTRGYDLISPSISNSDLVVCFEVKTSSRLSEYFSCYLSRNEADVAARTMNWYLLAVENINGKHSLIGHLQFSDFAEWLPSDALQIGRWETTYLRFPKSKIRPGLPTK